MGLALKCLGERGFRGAAFEGGRWVKFFFTPVFLLLYRFENPPEQIKKRSPGDTVPSPVERGGRRLPVTGLELPPDGSPSQAPGRADK